MLGLIRAGLLWVGCWRVGDFGDLLSQAQGSKKGPVGLPTQHTAHRACKEQPICLSRAAGPEAGALGLCSAACNFVPFLLHSLPPLRTPLTVPGRGSVLLLLLGATALWLE